MTAAAGTAMFTREGMRALHGWTHASLDVLLDHVATLPTDLFTKELEGFGFASVRDQLVHLLACEAGWVRDLQDLPFEGLEAKRYPTVQDVKETKEQVMATTLAYLEGLTPEELNAPLERRPRVWMGELRSPGFILHHIVTHAFHHKGQVAAMCRILGHPAPDTDLQR